MSSKWLLITAMVCGSVQAAPVVDTMTETASIAPAAVATASTLAVPQEVPAQVLAPSDAAPSLHSPMSATSTASVTASERFRLGSSLLSMGQSVASHTSDLLSTAASMIGIPYRRGGTSASTGFDCSGFVRAMYADTVGHFLPRTAHEQAKATTKIDKRELKPGDLVFFNTMRRAFSHVGIYVGEGKFIHAPSKGKTVRVESMESHYWSKRFNGARRVEVSERATVTSTDAMHLDTVTLH